MSIEDELIQEAEDDRLTVEYIRTHLPQELREKFSEDELYYFLDVLVEYYASSGILDQTADEDGCIDIDIDDIAKHLAEQAKRDKMGSYDPDDLRWIVEAEMDYAEQAGEE
jgi:hypothetical protein